MDLSPKALRARFAELDGRRDAIVAVSNPLRIERDTIASEAAARVAEIDEKVRTAEADLFEIDQERAMIARALGGRTGEPDAE